MILVTGGAFQGKTEYARTQLGVPHENILDGEDCSFDAVQTAECVKTYHQLIKRLLSSGVDPLDFTRRLCIENPDAVILMDEIGCGIIPLEKAERLWREAAGRAGCIIAGQAETVVRISCGIPVIIKGAFA
ncbi:MAG: bifunctional adenosylcobinamide kinase/adenosylcobinamide-phosphate guanylyltransferase [Ruminococcus sp.]|nr:bifunctional adenosylcobinamide kinase/adenosylcobinamide-phosphate guanylyltransferase [Ruminococcus sp.]